ncbi:hypothetical protein [Sphingomonas cavernae]|uniref:Uncharacterized protein n=1 Tax=Sphingomonas cavernae TaxID=2320861 RepID=A0A418WP58_9SPHN|nr:hypothetical protein [Sphingomonas cavernae]RJF93009.1 hypothetical protein D3876_01070 [Sphingomonas cavernae]
MQTGLDEFAHASRLRDGNIRGARPGVHTARIQSSRRARRKALAEAGEMLGAIALVIVAVALV